MTLSLGGQWLLRISLNYSEGCKEKSRAIICLYLPKTSCCPVTVKIMELIHGYIFMFRVKSFPDLPPAARVWLCKCSHLGRACRQILCVWPRCPLCFWPLEPPISAGGRSDAAVWCQGTVVVQVLVPPPQHLSLSPGSLLPVGSGGWGQVVQEEMWSKLQVGKAGLWFLQLHLCQPKQLLMQAMALLVGGEKIQKNPNKNKPLKSSLRKHVRRGKTFPYLLSVDY